MATPAPLIMVISDGSGPYSDLLQGIRQAGYDCCLVADEDRAAEEAKRCLPAAIVLDRNRRKVLGGDVLAQLRRDPFSATIPLMVLASGGEEADEVVAFALGADDYLLRPVSTAILVARLRALIRRREVQNRRNTILDGGPIVIHLDRREVMADGRQIQTTPTEYRLLRSIVAAQGAVISRAQLLEEVFSSQNPGDRRLDVHMATLRKKLGAYGGAIQTVRGVGYAYRESADGDPGGEEDSPAPDRASAAAPATTPPGPDAPR